MRSTMPPSLPGRRSRSLVDQLVLSPAIVNNPPPRSTKRFSAPPPAAGG